jgi:hypothetical protein
MSDGADSVRAAREAGEDPREVGRRIFRDTCAAAALAVVVSASVAPWRVTTGLALGGALAVFNLHWLSTSVAAVFGSTRPGARPRLGAARYVLRYFVAAGIVIAAVELNIVSLAATLAGMCATVAALLAEGLRQFYFAVTRREET